MWLIKRLDEKLQGAPDQFLTVLLLMIATIAIVVALKANPITKAFVAAWMIAP